MEDGNSSRETSDGHYWVANVSQDSRPRKSSNVVPEVVGAVSIVDTHAVTRDFIGVELSAI